MPYITEDRRPQITDDINRLPVNMTEGDVNFAITSLIDRELVLKGVSYKNINAMIGVLECVKLELYRRIAAPYEDKKCIENGDVYHAKP